MDTVLVLGASSDIGQEIIRRIAGPGMTIVAHYQTRPPALEVGGARIVPVQADFSSEDQVRALTAWVRDEGLAPNKIVHLAAPRVENLRFKDAGWNHFQDTIDVQLRSAVLVLREFLPEMASQRRGKVVFVLSSYTYNVPPKFLSHYVTGKYAVLGLMKALAIEYAGSGVNINAISPSMVETEFLRNIPAKVVEIHRDQHPLKRNATPSDVAPLAAFLLSPESDYITGANVPVTGGLTF
ncbi:MAG: SDR family NAD(P)-dependent oxidoreductase [Vicinamibacterales bacterium]